MNKFLFISYFIIFHLNLLTQEFNAEKIYEIADKSVVVIYAYDENGNISQGSGVIIDRNGLVATNYHVCRGAGKIEVKHYDKTFGDVSILAQDELSDLLILKLNVTFPHILVPAGTNSLKQGQRIFAIGSPEGYENSISEGIISGFRINSNNIRLIQMTAPITEGSSGGAVLNSRGELIGLSTSGQHEGNIYFTVPSDYIYELLETVGIKIENTDKVTKISDYAEEADYLSFGENAYRDNNFEDAEVYYSRHLEKFSNDFGILYKRAYSRFRLKDYQKAIADFTRVLESGTNKVETLFYRGNCYFMSKDYNRAYSDYTSALEIEPDNAEIYYNRGYTNLRLLRYEEAISDWKKAIMLKTEYEKELHPRITVTEELINKRK
ncbi:MAG: trypsin-like peptidase domain-containing protein [Ignavibacteria bacterium]|nr:trypsin-like peptidase domain-containing protein [Ignavibacteria bacterium]